MVASHGCKTLYDIAKIAISRDPAAEFQAGSSGINFKTVLPHVVV